MKKIIWLLCLICILPSCVAVVGGAAIGATGATVIYDRSNISSMYKDEKISYQIVEALQADKAIQNQCHIVVTTYNRIVLLAGQAPNDQLRQKVVSIAKTIPGIKRIYNEITIQGPSSALTRTSDTWITTKAKTILLATKNLSSGQFKVLTENGTVYLMGIVSRNQANIAVNAVRRIDGVQKVVKIFQYKQEPNNYNDDSANAPTSSPPTNQTEPNNASDSSNTPAAYGTI